VSERIVTLPHPRPPALKPWGRVRFGGAMRLRGAGVGAYGGGVGEGPGEVGEPSGESFL